MFTLAIKSELCIFLHFLLWNMKNSSTFGDALGQQFTLPDHYLWARPVSLAVCSQNLLHQRWFTVGSRSNRRRCQKWAFGCILISLSDCRQNMLIMSSMLTLMFEILLEILNRIRQNERLHCFFKCNPWMKQSVIFILRAEMNKRHWSQTSFDSIFISIFSFCGLMSTSVFPSTKIAAVLLCLWLNATKKSAIQWRHFFFWEQGPKDDFSGVYFTVGSPQKSTGIRQKIPRPCKHNNLM